MRRHDRPEVQVSGLLADRAAGFAAYLAGCGYARSSTKHPLYLMADLSAWLAGQGLAAEDLTGPVAGRFREDLRARGSYLVKGTSVEPLLGYLRSIGVLPQQRADGPASTAGALPQEYARYLRVGRRAGEVTITQYLRFLEQAGRTTRPLAGAVPRAARQPSRLPEQVDPATAAVILASCDRAAEGGCRDRAVLLLLHRYGLRPVEVTRLELPDLRWRAGEFVVHGKAGRVDVLPLLRDVGEAIVEYLRIRRPAPPGVAAVFLSARAPVQPMRKSSVGALVGRACARAGVPRTGPRAFRHAVGHDLLKGGASLVEIRDVLRHRDIETTSAYTRVDVSALRPLARPWPGTGKRQAAEMTP